MQDRNIGEAVAPEVLLQTPAKGSYNFQDVMGLGRVSLTVNPVFFQAVECKLADDAVFNPGVVVEPLCE